MALNPDFIAQFKAEVQRSLLLEDSDKQYWTTNTDKLPIAFLKSIYRLIRGKNKLMEKYIHEALKKDPDNLYLTNFQNKIKKLQLQTKEIDDQANNEDAETILKQMEN